jgi:CRISP-associated protein Cas1
MKRLLNTLYITMQQSYLARKGETIVVRADGEEKLRVPIHTLGQIVCFGQVSCSPALMGLCGERNVLLSFLTENGKFLARVSGPVSGNVLLRREQYRCADRQQQSAELARAVILAKVCNCRNVLLRAARDRPEAEGNHELKQASGYLSDLLGAIQKASTIDAVRGLEGEAAKTYFGVFNHLVSQQKDDFLFAGRNRRPPMDNINALLSFVYTLLMHDVTSALEAVGLDPAVGFLHRDRPGRASLALDLMEEFRAFLADRLVLSLINRQQVKGSGFKRTESGAVLMDDDTRKQVLVAWQKRKQEEVTHPFFNETFKVGLVPHAQAMLLARYLRDDLEAYPPFFWK